MSRFSEGTMRRKAELIFTLSYNNGRAGTLCIDRAAVDWYQIAGRLVEYIYNIVLSFTIAACWDSSLPTESVSVGTC